METVLHFNSKAVRRITGLTQRQLDYWDRTHFIKPSVSEASGYGSVRLYSFVDLVQLEVAKTIKDAGLSLQKMRRSIAYLKKHAPEIERPLAELRFLTDGDSLFVLTSDNRKLVDTLRNGQLVLSIAIGEIVSSLRGEVESLSRKKRYTVKVGREKYEVILEPDLEESGYVAECPSLPGCVTQGDTVEEALYMASDAIAGYLEAKREAAKGGKRRASSR